MSDKEDGELLSSGDEECTVDECEPQIKLNHDKNNNIETNHKSQWIYEQNNIKIECRDETVKLEEKYNNQSIFANNNQKNINRDRKRIRKPREFVEKKKPRKSDNFTTEKVSHTYVPSQKDVPQPKRRILCKYYAAGECKNGITCAFMHEDFPCKFFHDETSTCRAGSNCKYSHGHLSEEMKIILDGFIHEGKEKVMHLPSVPLFNNNSFVPKRSPQPISRTNCLLPTPALTSSSPVSSYDPDFNKSYNDISNYPDANYTKSNHVHTNVQTYPVVQKSKFLENFPKPGSEDFLRKQQNLVSRNNNNFQTNNFPEIHTNGSSFLPNYHQRPLHDIENSDESQGHYNSQNGYSETSFMSNDENIVPKVYNHEVMRSCTNNQKHLNHKIHAPARFIVGTHPQIKSEPESVPSVFDIDFKDALRKLADQIVVDPRRRSPSLENGVSIEIPEKMSPKIDTSHILKNVMKIEATQVRLNDGVSIFKKENDMSESEKMYIEEMKSLINLDAQFENIIPWKAIKLDITKKKPYILYVLKVNDIHDNPLADPRLIGHPVLNYIMKKEPQSPISDDGEEYPSLSISNDSELDSKPLGNDRSYLHNTKFRKRKIAN